MTDMDKFRELCKKNDIYYNHTFIWNDKNEKAGHALWLKVGHVEFDLNGKIKNVICY